MPVSFERLNDNITIAHIGCHRQPCLFPVGLLEFRAIDILQVNDFVAAIVPNGQLIALMDGDDSRDKISPCKRRIDHCQGKHETD